MPQILTEVVARPPLRGAYLGYLEQFLRDFSSSIELTRPDEIERTIHRLLLAAIICGAAIVRLWGLGDVGLHGDEETMGMAVRGIVEHGAPVLPSGMFYPRGLTQLYLMSASVALFGESEWALRLPSVLCGVVLVPVSYVLGRRFLRPHWNVAFAASLAFLPELIVYSQTARMYIFLVTCIAASTACVFAWERTNRVRWLVAAATLLVPGIEMHTLAVASVLIFLFPGIVQGDVRKIGAAVIAMAAVTIAFVAIDTFVNAQYPKPPADFVEQLGAAPIRGSAVVYVFPFSLKLGLTLAGIGFAYVGVRIARSMDTSAAAIVGAIVLLGGLALQLALFYHLAALCYLVGIAGLVRFGSKCRRRDLIVFAIGVAAIALSHASVIAPAAGTPLRLIGALIGQPSIWPYARVAQFSVVAGLLCAGVLFLGLYLLAMNRKAPDFWLLAILGLWAPVFALGLFAWDVPSRYTSMAVIPLLVCAFAMAQRLLDRVMQSTPVSSPAAADKTIAVVAVFLIVNPMATAATVNAGYRAFPDHKGAAEFMRKQRITDDDVVLAEDVLQQTYYLGRVDYWLIGPSVARRFVMKSESGVVDFYTGTPVIVTTAMLDGLLERSKDKRVFIIGTGEGWLNGKREVRGELDTAIESDRFETLYVGRDGLTRVLRAVAPTVQPKASTPPLGAEGAPEKKITSPEDQRALERALIEAPED